MSERRRGLGRGLGALIPSGPTGERPTDVFFGDPGVAAEATRTLGETPAEEGDAVVGTGTLAGVTDHDGAVAPDGGAPDDHVEDARADLRPVPGTRFAELDVAAIAPNPRQPRTHFDHDELAELVHSVREVGVLQPVVVRSVGVTDGLHRYELVMGERRWRACLAADLERIPAIIRETPADDLLRDALLENLHRSDLNPLEEAAAYQQLLDDFGCTHEELAHRLGRSRPQISNTVRLLRLPPLVQRRVAAGVLSAGHARALLSLPDPAAMERLAQRVVAENLSVRATEELVAVGGISEPDPATRQRAPRAGERHAALDELAGRLSDRLDTRVRITLGRRRGTLAVDFASVEDLDRILAVLAPGEAQMLGRDTARA